MLQIFFFFYGGEKRVGDYIFINRKMYVFEK